MCSNCFIGHYGDLNCLSCEKMPLKGEKLPRASEHQEQVALFKVFALHERKYPELAAAFAVPNGQLRMKAIAVRLKAEGVRSGVPDIFIPAARGTAHGLFVELKSTSGTLSPVQKNMMAALTSHGYACIWAKGWETAWEKIIRLSRP